MTELTYRGTDGCPLHATIIDPALRAATADVGPLVVLLHGGGPDHRMLIPLAQQLADYKVVLPDIRGYGRSICADPSRHTWSQYADDVIALMDRLRVHQVVVGGAGLGTTITLRTAVAYPDRVSALVLISVEDIEGDQAKEAEIVFLDAFAARVRAEGIEAGLGTDPEEPRSDHRSHGARGDSTFRPGEHRGRGSDRPRPLLPQRRRARRDREPDPGHPRDRRTTPYGPGRSGCADSSERTPRAVNTLDRPSDGR